MYTHLEPKGILERGTFVNGGEIIAKVGPKYVTKSPYMDGSGRYTNGLTTGPHLHFGVKCNINVLKFVILLQFRYWKYIL